MMEYTDEDLMLFGSELSFACHIGNKKDVEKCLKKLKDESDELLFETLQTPDSRNCGNLPIHNACEGLSEECLALLLDLKSDQVNAVNDCDETPLMIALALMDTKMVSVDDWDPRGDEGWLHDMSTYGCPQRQKQEAEACVRLLLNHPAVKVTTRSIDGRTPLHHAVNIGSVQLVQKILELGADPNQEFGDVKDELFETDLMESEETPARGRHTKPQRRRRAGRQPRVNTQKVEDEELHDTYRTILDGFNERAACKFFARSLTFEQYENRSYLYRDLVDGKLSPLLFGCALLWLSKEPPVEAVLALLEVERVDVNKPFEGRTPLFHAIKARCFPVIKRLVELGSDPTYGRILHPHLIFKGHCPLSGMVGWSKAEQSEAESEQYKEFADCLIETLTLPRFREDHFVQMHLLLLLKGIAQPFCDEFVDQDNSPPGLRVLKDGRFCKIESFLPYLNKTRVGRRRRRKQIGLLSPQSVMTVAIRSADLWLIRFLLSLRVKRAPSIESSETGIERLVPAIKTGQIYRDNVIARIQNTRDWTPEDLREFLQALEDTFGKGHVEEVVVRSEATVPLFGKFFHDREFDFLFVLASFVDPSMFQLEIEYEPLYSTQPAWEFFDLKADTYYRKRNKEWSLYSVNTVTSQPHLVDCYRKVDLIGFMLLQSSFRRPKGLFCSIINSKLLHPSNEVLPPLMAMFMGDYDLQPGSEEAEFMEYLVAQGFRLRSLKHDIPLIVERTLGFADRTADSEKVYNRALLPVRLGLFQLGWYKEPSVYKTILEDRLRRLKWNKSERCTYLKEARKLIHSAMLLLVFVNKLIGNGKPSLKASHDSICNILHVEADFPSWNELEWPAQKEKTLWEITVSKLHCHVHTESWPPTDTQFPRRLLKEVLFKEMEVEKLNGLSYIRDFFNFLRR